MACETKLITELSSVKERYREYEVKNEELERKVQLQQEQIYELKEELMAAQAEVKMQATRTEGRKEGGRERGERGGRGGGGEREGRRGREGGREMGGREMGRE